MSSVNLVKEFHETFGHPIATIPSIPDAATIKFRVEFMKEESDETEKACKEKDLVELADGLGDIQYVLDGFFLNAGLHEKKDEILAEIHRSNMTKMCLNINEAEETIEAINSGGNPEDHADYRQAENKKGFVVFRKRDGKILKSLYFEKPNLKKVIYGE